MRFLATWMLAVILVGSCLIGCDVDRSRRTAETSKREEPLRLAFITCAVHAKFFRRWRKACRECTRR